MRVFFSPITTFNHHVQKLSRSKTKTKQIRFTEMIPALGETAKAFYEE